MERPFDPVLDLRLERDVPLPPEKVWEAYVTPALLKQWFCPLPWTVSECQIDLRPGGIFRTVMRSPEGQDFPYAGRYVEIVPNRRLVWTDAQPADLPADHPSIVATITMEPDGKGGTRYVAIASHKDADARVAHEKMGFYEGWGKALDQLVALMSGKGA